MLNLVKIIQFSKQTASKTNPFGWFKLFSFNPNSFYIYLESLTSAINVLGP